MLLYRLLLTLFSPIVLGAFLLRLLRRQEALEDLKQRLGGGAGERRAIWVHGASVGNTVSARDAAQRWGIENVIVRLAPLDAAWIVRRFLKNWQPCVLVNLESEIWPNRIRLSTAPNIFVAARLSHRSARIWAMFPKFSRQVFSKIDFLWAQDWQSGKRFEELGLQKGNRGSDISLKSNVALPAVDPEELAQVSRYFDRDFTFMAASTHEGEDLTILDAVSQMQGKWRLILAPRHPKRASDIRRLAENLGLSVAQRSLNEIPDKDVYIVDTFGEMSLWYSLSSVTFVGASLVKRNGHTPFEPIQFGSAVLHGPHVENFAQIYALLDHREAAICVSDANGIMNALKFLETPIARNSMTQAANAVRLDLPNGHEEVLILLASKLNKPTNLCHKLES